MKHYPVMLPEVVNALSPCAGETYIDATFGHGGYSEAFLQTADCRVIGLDRDPHVQVRAAELAQLYPGRFELIETEFSRLDDVSAGRRIDAVILDIGVSSMQLDQAGRGFSFMRSGPLDMRMGAEGITASEVVNRLSHQDLIRIFQVYGEEKRARRVADFIIRARAKQDIVTTEGLVEILEKALSRPHGQAGKIHPATRVFQALRIFVNDELGELYRGLCAAERVLNPGGRLIIVTFHSLEDRIVKAFLRRRSEAPARGSRYHPEPDEPDFYGSFTLPRRRAFKPSALEVRQNPRSRSAKLRVAVRTDAPVFSDTDTLLPEVMSVYDMAAT